MSASRALTTGLTVAWVTLAAVGCERTALLGSAIPSSGDGGGVCNSDSECRGAPANICSAGACVPGCGASSCPSPAACNSATGHCETQNCTADTQCDDGSYCNQAGQCSVLAYGGHTDCDTRIGTIIADKCYAQTDAAGFASCIGAPGPAGCPYCFDDSCFQTGLCSDDNDCHAESHCVSGICQLRAPDCSAPVAIADLQNGIYAAGKEVCVTGTVAAEESDDGFYQVRLDASGSMQLYLKISPLYATVAAVTVPMAGQSIVAHGTVRWDQMHQDWEMSPVDYVVVTTP